MKNLQTTNYKLQTNLGFTLLETVIAISILTTGVIATIGLMNSGLKQIGYLKNKIIAINLAQEGIELTRNVRDNNWLTNLTVPPPPSPPVPFNVWTGTGTADECSSTCKYEIDYDDTKLVLLESGRKLKLDQNTDLNKGYQYDTGNNSIFTRTITITDDPDENFGTADVRVESTVKFGDKENEEVTLETILYDWKK